MACFCLLETQVIRKPGYKGAVATVSSLPVDAATALGMIVVLACVLPTSTLTADAVKECLGVFEAMESKLDSQWSLQLLPHEPQFCLAISEGMASAADLKNMLKELALPWCKCLVPSLMNMSLASFCQWKSLV